MDLYLIRHGDPDYENDTLTARGHEEARLLANCLRDLPIAAILQSPCGRARITCEYTARLTQVRPITLNWLREADIMRGDLYLWSAPGSLFLSDNSLPTFEDALAPDGAMPEGQARFEEVSRAFDETMVSFGYTKHGHLYRVEQRTDRAVLLFSHAGAIKTLLSYLLHWSLPLAFVHSTVSPTGTTRVRMDERDGLAHARLMTFNSLAHLSCSRHSRLS